MSVYIQEVLGLLNRNKKKLKLDGQKDHFEFGRLYSSGTLNTGTSYAPKMEPFVIKFGDLKCDILTDVVLQNGTATVKTLPMYAPVSGSCVTQNTSIEDSIASQSTAAGLTSININGGLIVEQDAVLKTKVVLGTAGDVVNGTSLLNRVLDSAGAEAGGANRILRSLADGRVVWSNDDPVVTLNQGCIWVGDASNLQSQLCIGAAGTILVSNGTTISYQTLASQNVVTGTGTANHMTMWTGTNTIGNGSIVPMIQTPGGAGVLTIGTADTQTVITDAILYINGPVKDAGGNLGTAGQVLISDGSSQVLWGANGSSYTWKLNDGTITGTVTDGEVVQFLGGAKIATTLTVAGGNPEKITFSHLNTTRTDTTSAVSPAAGATFTVIGSVTQDATGHPTALNVKTVTLPASGGGSMSSFNIQGDGGSSVNISNGETINFIGGPGLDAAAVSANPNTLTFNLDTVGTDNFVQVWNAATPVASDIIVFSDISDSNTVRKAAISALPFDQYTSWTADSDQGTDINVTSGTTLKFAGLVTSGGAGIATDSAVSAGDMTIALVNAGGTPSATTFYRGDGQWITPSTGVTAVAFALITGATVPLTGSVSGTTLTINSNKFGGNNLVGYVPSSSGSNQSTAFLRADGTWQVPAGGGGSTTVNEGLGITVTGTASSPIVGIDYLGSDNAILEAPSADVAGPDFIWYSDTSDSGNIKKDTVAKLLNQGSFTLTDGTTQQTINLGNTLSVLAGSGAGSGGITSVVSATDTVTLSIDTVGTDNIINVRTTEVNLSPTDYIMFSDISDNTVKKATINNLPGYYQKWTLNGDGGSAQDILNLNTVLFAGGTGLTTAVSATDTLTINHTDSITAATVTNPSSITFNGSGHITAIVQGTAPTVGTVTSVTPGEGLELEAGSTTVNPTIGVNYTGGSNIMLVPGAGTADATDIMLFNDASDGNSVKKTAISALPVVTSLTAGTGCSSVGGPTGAITLNVTGGAGLLTSADEIAVDYIGTDSIIQSATNASGAIPDGADLIIYQDVDDNNTVKYTQVKHLVISDPGPTDYFSFDSSGIVNQGQSVFAGNNLVAYNSGTGLYTITLNATRSNANYLIQASVFDNAGVKMLQCRTRGASTTQFLLDVIDKDAVIINGSSLNYTIAITMYK